MNRKVKYGIILCSGGVDSVVTAYYIKEKMQYDKIIILFFNYGQKSLKNERNCARNCARKLFGKFIELKLDELEKISTSLINKSGKVNKVKRSDLIDTRKESEKWYVPFRNAIFLMYALALAESIYIKERKTCNIFVGFKYEGQGGFPDATLNFLNKMNELGKIGKKRFKIIAPLINKDKSEVILLGKKLGIDLFDTHSCYISNKHCGYCLACRLRQEGFYWANIKDMTKYRKKMSDFRTN